MDILNWKTIVYIHKNPQNPTKIVLLVFRYKFFTDEIYMYVCVDIQDATLSQIEGMISMIGIFIFMFSTSKLSSRTNKSKHPANNGEKQSND